MKSVIKRNRKLYAFNRKLRVSIMIISVILLFGMIINLCAALNNHSFIYEKKSLYSYNNKANVDYTAALKPTAYDLFGGQKTLDEGNTYITDFIDEIDPSFTYDFTGERPAEINGHYQVYAIIQGLLGSEKSSKAAWQKKIIIQDQTNFSSSNGKISVKTSNPIKLENYKQIIDKTIKGINIQFNIKFTVYWDVQLAAKTDKGTVNERLCPTMDIPLYSNTFEVGGQLSQEKNGAIKRTEKIAAPVNKNMIILSSALILISAVALIFIIIFTTNNIPDNPFTKKIKNIFKQHGDRLVALRSIMNITNQPKFSVADINDLVRVADEISKPILYIHDEDINQITKFYVIDEKAVYLYDIREV